MRSSREICSAGRRRHRAALASGIMSIAQQRDDRFQAFEDWSREGASEDRGSHRVAMSMSDYQISGSSVPNQAPEPTCLLPLRLRSAGFRSTVSGWSKQPRLRSSHVAHL
jgi:hypothetical protein